MQSATGPGRASTLHKHLITMTLRMVLQAAKEEVSLALHGWLTGPEVAEFVRVAAATPLPLRVDLTNLVSADLPGIPPCRRSVRGARTWPTRLPISPSSSRVPTSQQHPGDAAGGGARRVANRRNDGRAASQRRVREQRRPQ